MRLSVTTYPWGPLKDAEHFARVCATIRGIGFEGVGIEFDLLPEELKARPQLVPPILERSGLRNGGTYSPVKERELEWSVASRTPLMWVSVYEKEISVALDRLGEYARRCAKAGVTCALHNELGSSIQTQAEIARALDSIPEMKLCLDTAHGEGAGVDLAFVIERYKDRLALVHLKDLREKLPMSAIKFERDFVNVGHGVVDLRGVVKALRSAGYDGELMLEIEALAGADPDKTVQEGYDYTRRLLQS